MPIGNAISWQQLLASLNDVAVQPKDKAWDICRYMQAHVGTAELDSENARTLLLCYMQLPLQHPSLVHSLMLGVAVKMSESYADFRFVQFLNLWHVSNLRTEDKQPQAGKDGRTYSSLLEKVTKAYIRYKMTHPEEHLDDAFRALINAEAMRLGYKPAMHMIAVKMFETQREGRKLRSVKLVSAKGDELLADWHAFNAKPFEIVGRMYLCVPRQGKTGALRAEHIVPSQQAMSSVFPVAVGYVDRYDAEHQHYHIYDVQSRHFVAERPALRLQVGNYVLFCPVIPQVDKFKSAIVQQVMDKYKGREQFGARSAVVQFVNTEKNYLKYRTEDGDEGFCSLQVCPKDVKQGDNLRLILFLKRGKDLEKRPYVAEAY